MLIAFELLQESGIHLPQAIGQSVSTIGGIVVGTAAVEAGLIDELGGLSAALTCLHEMIAEQKREQNSQTEASGGKE